MCYVVFDKEVEGATVPGQKVMIIATSKLIFSYLDTARYELPDGREAWFFKEHSVIGKMIRNYWEEMIESDPEEFTNVVGIKNLASWALGRPAGPGYIQVSSLQEWLDLFLDLPEEEMCDHFREGEIVEVKFSPPDVVESLGFVPTVAIIEGY